jgi:hypothetical protein
MTRVWESSDENGGCAQHTLRPCFKWWYRRILYCAPQEEPIDLLRNAPAKDWRSISDILIADEEFRVGERGSEDEKWIAFFIASQ